MDRGELDGYVCVEINKRELSMQGVGSGGRRGCWGFGLLCGLARCLWRYGELFGILIRCLFLLFVWRSVCICVCWVCLNVVLSRVERALAGMSWAVWIVNWGVM